MKLSDTALRALKPTGAVQKLSDGGGLFLYVTPTGSKLWRMAYRFNGKQKTLSFGPYPAVSLKDARARRDQAKEMLAAGIDPGERKKEIKAAAVAAQKEATNTFESVALEWFESYSPTLSEKHAHRVDRYLRTLLFPAFGKTPVAEIEAADILAVVRPIEARQQEVTAHKLINTCNQVLRLAVLTGRSKFNAAAGLSAAIRPVQSRNLPAITEPKEIGRLLRDIDNFEGFYSIKYFLKILPYVFTRPSEIRLGEWAEINFDAKIWRIPAHRMKMRKEHTVPLSRQVCELLEELHLLSGRGKYVFPSIRAKSATITDAGPLAALRRLGYTQDQMCLHGFRAMASTRLNELGFRADVIEAQLAHKESDAVRLAYNRAEYMEERRKLMQSWADYLDVLRSMN